MLSAGILTHICSVTNSLVSVKLLVCSEWSVLSCKCLFCVFYDLVFIYCILLSFCVGWSYSHACECVSVGVHMPEHMCGGQRTALGVLVFHLVGDRVITSVRSWAFCVHLSSPQKCAWI